jgi:hypothetical protein
VGLHHDHPGYRRGRVALMKSLDVGRSRVAGGKAGHQTRDLAPFVVSVGCSGDVGRRLQSYGRTRKSPGRLFPVGALSQCMSGGVLLSHTVTSAVPSALKGLASGFGMEPGVSPSL